MDVGDAASDRVLDRDHPKFGRPVLQRREGVLECGAGERREVGVCVDTSDVRIGPWLPLIGDCAFLNHARPGARMARARSRSSGASTPRGAVSTIAMSMRMPASSARNCSKLLAPFERRRRAGHKTSQRLAPIGVKTDVMEELALAPGRAGAGEIERPQSAGTDFGSDRLDDIRIILFLFARDRSGERRDVDLAVGKGRKARSHDRSLDRRKIALHVDHNVVVPRRIDQDSALRKCGRSRMGAQRRLRWPFRPPPRPLQ